MYRDRWYLPHYLKLASSTYFVTFRLAGHYRTNFLKSCEDWPRTGHSDKIWAGLTGGERSYSEESPAGGGRYKPVIMPFEM